MEKFHIICVDDQPEVLFQLAHDLAEFSDWVKIKLCSDAFNAQSWIDKLDQEGCYACVIVSDQHMPGLDGVDWLQELANDRRFCHTKTVMLSQNPNNQMLIDAINKAHIDRFFCKPWDSECLVIEVRILLTEYIFEKGIEYEPWQAFLDPETIFKYLQGVTS